MQFLKISPPETAVRGLRGREASGPLLRVTTPGGSVRNIELTRAQLLDVIQQSVTALRVLDRQEADQ